MLKYILILGSFLLCLIYLCFAGYNNDIALLLTHSCICLISCFFMFYDTKRSYSIFKIVMVFFLFFIGIAPYIQYANDITFWHMGKIDAQEHFYFSSIFLLILIFYIIVYHLILNGKSEFTGLKKLFSNIPNTHTLSTSKRVVIFLIGLFVLLYCIKSKGGLIFMFVRGLDVDKVKGYGVMEMTGTQFLIVNYFLRPFNIFLFLAGYVYYRKKYPYFVMLLGVLGLISYFPTGIARFAAAATYICVCLCCFKFFRRKFVLVISLVLGLLVLFPLFNLFRVFGKKPITLDALELGVQFYTPDFDSFESLVNVVRMEYITYGRQLIGNIFFFIPRNIWPTKPIGSGHLIATELGNKFTNISCNYFAEGYINCGYLGIIIAVIVLAWFTAKMDNTYWLQKNNNQAFNILYFVCFGMVFFILRGDLLSSISYLVGFSLSYYCAYRLFKI